MTPERMFTLYNQLLELAATLQDDDEHKSVQSAAFTIADILIRDGHWNKLAS